MTKRLILLLLTGCLALPLIAEDEDHRGMNPHMLRIGWGDQHFEHLAWHATPQPLNTLPVSYSAVYGEHYRYTQHWFIEYQNRINRWFSYGGLVDGSGVVWDNVTRNGKGDETARDKNHSLFNIVLMPTIYFTYFHHPYVSLYSGLGVGLDINGGTETDAMGRKTVAAPAFNLSLLGVSAWYRNWFLAVELGAMLAFNDGQNIYLGGSRLISASIGVTF